MNLAWNFKCKLKASKRHPSGVLDGDTVDLIIDLGFGIYIAKRCRLFELDAPETRTTDLDEKALGLHTKERLIERLSEAEALSVTSVKWSGKYGRFIGVIYADGVNVNEWLIGEGLAARKIY